LRIAIHPSIVILLTIKDREELDGMINGMLFYVVSPFRSSRHLPRPAHWSDAQNDHRMSETKPTGEILRTDVEIGVL
jgi:hypothetical protein